MFPCRILLHLSVRQDWRPAGTTRFSLEGFINIVGMVPFHLNSDSCTSEKLCYFVFSALYK